MRKSPDSLSFAEALVAFNASTKRRQPIGQNHRVRVLELLGSPDHEFPRALEYDYIHGDLVADWFALPFSALRQSLVIEFDEAGERVRVVESHD